MGIEFRLPEYTAWTCLPPGIIGTIGNQRVAPRDCPMVTPTVRTVSILAALQHPRELQYALETVANGQWLRISKESQNSCLASPETGEDFPTNLSFVVPLILPRCNKDTAPRGGTVPGRRWLPTH